MRLADFDFYHDFLLEKTGLNLTQEQAYIVDSRLTPIARKWGFANLETLTMAMRGVPPAELAREIIESMMTHETSFFRDLDVFNHLRDVTLPALMKARRKQKRISIWCVGVSTGQEAYSIAMLLKELPKTTGWTFEILGTDLVQDVLDKAERGNYSQSDAQRGLSIHLLLKYFDQKKDGQWHAKRALKSIIEFKRHNVMEPLRSVGMPDIILCRNVLDECKADVRESLVFSLSRAMADDGTLCLGRDESADGLEDLLAPAPGAPGLFTLIK